MADVDFCDGGASLVSTFLLSVDNWLLALTADCSPEETSTFIIFDSSFAISAEVDAGSLLSGGLLMPWDSTVGCPVLESSTTVLVAADCSAFPSPSYLLVASIEDFFEAAETNKSIAAAALRRSVPQTLLFLVLVFVSFSAVTQDSTKKMTNAKNPRTTKTNAKNPQFPAAISTRSRSTTLEWNHLSFCVVSHEYTYIIGVGVIESYELNKNQCQKSPVPKNQRQKSPVPPPPT